jgi:hypothetical protein
LRVSMRWAYGRVWRLTKLGMGMSLFRPLMSSPDITLGVWTCAHGLEIKDAFSARAWALPCTCCTFMREPRRRGPDQRRREQRLADLCVNNGPAKTSEGRAGSHQCWLDVSDQTTDYAHRQRSGGLGGLGRGAALLSLSVACGMR